MSTRGRREGDEEEVTSAGEEGEEELLGGAMRGWRESGCPRRKSSAYSQKRSDS
jgi:hypothetical protein